MGTSRRNLITLTFLTFRSMGLGLSFEFRVGGKVYYGHGSSGIQYVLSPILGVLLYVLVCVL
ncbi:hypothetical protein BDV36DRAFT_255068 [Aspergillus pseudocaelatus]|uniref:Amino acid permease/ SLC12A domain-containing protein n=1 Tax=Aspergillus pseudocaelatus TaxID=1825620 RepID=A0ABQ6WLJ4_9EURO|nr:hypothetical protein BDV36DRAFT_255068 [Aspergillus pseudocaelatus]